MSALRLPDLLAARSFVHRDGQKAIADLSIVQPLVEELIVEAPQQILVEDTALAMGALGHLPDLLRDRVRVVDGAPVAMRMEGLLRPVYHEFGVELVDWSRTGWMHTQERQLYEHPHQREAGRLLFSLLRELYPLFFGLTYGVPAEFSVRKAALLSRQLRVLSRGAEALRNLAMLEGVLRSYTRRDRAALSLTASGEQERLEAFRCLVEDVAWQETSSAAYDLGIVGKAEAALSRLRELARRLVARPGARGVLRYARDLIVGTVGVPFPDVSEFLRSDGGYLPPVISLDPVRERAVKVWLIRNPPAISPLGFDRAEYENLRWEHVAVLEQTYSIRAFGESDFQASE